MVAVDEFLATVRELGITHVVGVPDSTFGPWFDALRATDDMRLVSVCREGEAWGVAAGLHLGGARPLVMMQCTGLFESGDSLRNAIYDFQLPLYALIGYRNYLRREVVQDTTLHFTEPILRAWGLEPLLIDARDKWSLISEHYAQCRRDERAGVALIAEGSG